MFPVLHVHALSMSFYCRCIWYLASGNGIICSVQNSAYNDANGTLLRTCGCFWLFETIPINFPCEKVKAFFHVLWNVFLKSRIALGKTKSTWKAKIYSFLMKFDKLHGWHTICLNVDNNESKWQITMSIWASKLNKWHRAKIDFSQLDNSAG